VVQVQASISGRSRVRRATVSLNALLGRDKMLIPLHHLFELSSFQFDTETKENDFSDDLSPIAPRFFVPLLEDKPQNPILESLRLEAANLNLPDRRAKVKDWVGNKEALEVKEDEFLVEVLSTESAEKKLGIRVCGMYYLLQIH
jgi:hypothetical protein